MAPESDHDDRNDRNDLDDVEGRDGVDDEDPGAESPQRLTADEFNLWCAFNDRPFRLARYVWPDGVAEWDIEANPGSSQQMVAYGTGEREEGAAAAAAFAFIAGVEWGEAVRRSAREASGDFPDDGDDDADSRGPSRDGSNETRARGRLAEPPDLDEDGAAQPRPAGDTRRGDASGAVVVAFPVGRPPVADGLAASAAAAVGATVVTVPGVATGSAPGTDGGPVTTAGLGADAGATGTLVTEDDLVIGDLDGEAEDVYAGALDGPDDGLLDDDALDDGLVDDEDEDLDILDDEDLDDDDLDDDVLDDEDLDDEDLDDDVLDDEDLDDLDDDDAVFEDRAAVDNSAVPAADVADHDGDDVLDDPPLPEVYQLPAVTLMQEPLDRKDRVPDEAVLAANARALETVLRNFRVRGEIMDVRLGPVVTLYELEPVPGTKSSTVINLADDIARSMRAISARIAIVPGRSVIGIELPNELRETVYLREILASPAFHDSSATLALALGKDISGNPVVVDLARMPHLLIAGTTGSGKSVGINTMILSLLYRLPPEQCRLIMIDPKMLELSIYDGIPHLLAPVVTDSRKAVLALKWAVREMESRYRSMASLGVRNIEGYNARVREMIDRGERMPLAPHVAGIDRGARPDEGLRQPETLPYIVVVVDEMADLMLVAGRDIEAAIQRLAQMARAAGIHLIMATQRPSVDVITGTIKANFPTRISFQVTSKIDSRTILGDAGAEQLVGQGDMLHMAAGGRIMRVHGPFVADAEVESVVRFLKTQGRPQYLETVTEDEEDARATSGGPDEFDSSGDELYDRALALVVREQKVSVSFIQRHLQIGYNRSARIVERMETEGVISPANHVGKREIRLGRGGPGGSGGDSE